MKTIIVLSNGETWDTGGYIVTLTDKGFKKLQSGAFKPYQLDAKDHLMEVSIVIKEPKEIK